MPRGIYQKKCTNKKSAIFNPLPHQQLVLDYFSKSPHKGLLLYHKLGSGKTCTSIMVADKMIRNKEVKHVFVLTPGSLRKNWIEEYCKTCGFMPEYLEKYFTFITYNYDVHKELKKISFNNSLVIVDEIHNLINGVRNESANSTALYEKMRDANCRILALSGTPIFGRLKTWPLLGNLLKPGTFDPENFIDCPDEDFQGIISYFPGNPAFYPTMYYHEPIKVQMAKIQAEGYKTLLEWESERFNPKKLGPHATEKQKSTYKMLKMLYIIAKLRIMTRGISNFYYDGRDFDIYDNITDPDSKLLESTLDDMVGAKVLVYWDSFSEDIYDKFFDDENDNYKPKRKPDRLKKAGGWVSDEILKNKALLNVFSPKFTALILNIILNINTKHVVYTFFKTKAGVELIKTLLGKCGIKSAIFSGDLTDEERVSVLKRFNDEKNRDGDNIKVLLLTSAGMEGISIMEVNNMHILESETNVQKSEQAIGRVARYKSHFNMPSDRQYVNVWRYWAYPSEDAKGIDEILYINGLTEKGKIDRYLTRIIENSIES